MPNPIMNIAVTGVQAAKFTTEVAASNIANAQTNGYKPFAAYITDMPYRITETSSVNDSGQPIATQLGRGARNVGTFMMQLPGEYTNTKQPLDMALSGPGYFAISAPDAPNGRLLKRDGNFKMDNTRRIVDANGNALVGAGGDIIIPDDIDISTIKISNEGIITATDPDQNIVDIGEVQIFNVPNDKGLLASGSNAFKETDDSGEAEIINDIGITTILQYNIESSAVSSITELTNMIEAQHANTLNTRVIKIADEMEKEISNIKS